MLSANGSGQAGLEVMPIVINDAVVIENQCGRLLRQDHPDLLCIVGGLGLAYALLSLPRLTGFPVVPGAGLPKLHRPLLYLAIDGVFQSDPPRS